MSHFGDRIKETTTTTGTGDITLLGAVAQFQTVFSRFPVGDIFSYARVEQTGTEWETGIGHLSSSTVLVRDKVFQSSNSDALVNFSAGTSDVFVTITAHYANAVTTQGKVSAGVAGLNLP